MSGIAVIFVVLGGVLAVCVFGFGIYIAFQATRKIENPAPRVSQGPDGRYIEIPTRQTSAVMMSAPAIALARYAGPGMFRVTPRGIEYRVFRRKSVPYEEITQVDAPYQSRPHFVTVGVRGRLGVAILTASPQGTDAALFELSQRCQLTPLAWQRIAHLYPAGPRN